MIWTSSEEYQLYDLITEAVERGISKQRLKERIDEMVEEAFRQDAS
jgi:hypothetical protein